MRILFPDIHTKLTRNIVKAFNLLGHEVIVPSSEYIVTYNPPPQYNQFVWSTGLTDEDVKSSFGSGCHAWSKERILDEPPDVTFIVHFEAQFEILLSLYPMIKDKTKLAFYSGNDYWEGAYPIDIVRNYLAADQTGVSLINKYKFKNSIWYKPYVDYEKYSFAGNSNSNLVCSYINLFDKHWPELFKQYDKDLRNMCPETRFRFLSEELESVVLEHMEKSMATIHPKPVDGYGFAIIESMARGRPVFANRRFAYRKSYSNWLRENLTGFYYDSLEELSIKIKLLQKNEEYRHYIQTQTANLIRAFVNNDEEQAKLKRFLQNLI